MPITLAAEVFPAAPAGHVPPMSLLRKLGRPLLASIFIVQGLETFRHPEHVAPRAEPIVQPLARQAPGLVPADTEQAVRINGAVQVAAGALLAVGMAPRLAATALAGTLVPTTLAGHRYWESEDPQERAQQRIHFLKNLTMLGGLLIAAADTGDAPSLRWRRQAAQRRASHHFQDLSEALAGSAHVASDLLTAAAQSSAKAAQGAAHTAAGAAQSAAQTAADASRRATAQLVH